MTEPVNFAEAPPASGELPRIEPPNNQQIGSVLDEVATLLEAQGANPFRVRAYRNAAETIRELKGQAADIVAAEGVRGLMLLPHIGTSISDSIVHFVRTGRLPLLERLRGEDIAEKTFASVADIGPRLAARIHETLGIETLQELEAAAYDGRLASVPGIGTKRLRAVRESLAGRFSRRAQRVKQPAADSPPSRMDALVRPAEAAVAELLDVDREYRTLAAQHRLPRIAPRRFNPTRESWLPVLHTQRGDRHYTALFSNTAHAHEVGATHDWVVIYRDDHEHHGRWTVITAQFGELKGRRIIRGLEAACTAHYAGAAETATNPRSKGSPPATRQLMLL